MEIVEKNGSGYEDARKIANARFDYYPQFICYCEVRADVVEALRFARRRKLPVRVRSGGHHHEGMCSGNGVVIIDLSRLSRIRFSGGGSSAWIEPGARLKDVYSKMEEKERLFPGGGCGDVRVGGLVQGGGWGPYSRLLGLTCDSLTGVRLVTAAGKPGEVTEEGSDRARRLLWAIRGGGGGNFAVATGFRFRLAPRPSPVHDFTLEWEDPDIVGRVIREWRTHFPGDSCEELTSFCRVSVTGDESEDPPVLIGGAFVGGPDALCDTLKRLLPGTFQEAKTDVCAPLEARPAPVATGFTHPGYQPGPPLAALRRRESLAGVSDSDLSQTCAGIPYPHKVSSCFPRPGFGDDGDRAITDFVSRSAHLPEARLYLSLHCMGGAVGRGGERSSFAYRDRPFMLQYQAWWAHPGDHELGKRCLRWVRGFRKAMREHTEGAFINFPDVDLVPDPETPAGRLKLLRFYYADNLKELIDVKREWDPGNVLDFEMGIPTSG